MNNFEEQEAILNTIRDSLSELMGLSNNAIKSADVDTLEGNCIKDFNLKRLRLYTLLKEATYPGNEAHKFLMFTPH